MWEIKKNLANDFSPKFKTFSDESEFVAVCILLATKYFVVKKCQNLKKIC